MLSRFDHSQRISPASSDLVVVAHEMHEHGIDPDAFGSPPKVELRIICYPTP